MDFKFPLFFNTLENKPVRGSEDFYRLIDEEVYKLENGITVDGVYISGWLYWHLNHWYIRINKKEDNGNITRLESLPYLRDNEWIRAEALEECRKQQKGYMEIGLRQGGKALHNSSILYTGDSEITIGDCKVGDQIYDDQGKLTTITNKFPQGIRPVYKMTLVDGREILCDLNHKWKVYNRLSKKYEVRDTKELCGDYKKIRKDWEGVRKNPYEFKYSIPCNKAVKYEEKNLPIDPYILGLWLGDGSNTYSKITSIDEEIVDYLHTYSESIGLQITPDSFYTHMITSGKQGGDKNLVNKKNIVHQYLKKLYNNKHIPKEYFYSSVDQRMELLRGLMDSDGSCDKRGKIEFSSSIPILADDFYNLCRSLGINLSKIIKKTSYKKNNIKINCKDTTRFILYTNKPVFKLSRKLERICQTPKYLHHTAIVNIEYVYDDYTTCITVDNESNLFLTDNYTVTHNSELEASYLAYNAILFKNTQNVIVGSNTPDIDLLKDKIDFGLKKIWEGIAIPRLDKTWRTSSVRLGYKLSSGEDDIWSTIIIRNSADGNNTETAAGTTAKSYIMDEVGKARFSKVFEAAKPALTSEYGWRAVPILVGCLTAGNKVFTKNGNLVNIENLNKKDGIIGFNQTKQTTSLEDIIHINPPQEKECYEVITNKGSKIECSYDHPILIKHRNKIETISSNKRRRILEFVDAENIKIGDVVSVPSIIPLQGNRTIENPYFIGAIIGDGNYSSDRGIRFYNEDQEIWDYLDSINKDYTVFKSHITTKNRLYREARFRGGTKQLKELGIYGQSGINKDLPLNIHLCNEKTICELLAGLFDTDGCVVADNIKNNYVFLSSGSEKLIDSVKLLLLRLGIHSNKSFKKGDKRNRKIKSSKGYYDLYIADRESILIFINKIPLKINRKKEKLQCLKKFFNNKKSQLDSNYPGLRFEKVVSVKKVGLKPVYNLTTDTTHTYLANGIVTHNTGGSFDKGEDAERFFYHPDANNFLGFVDPESGRKTCLFMSGLYRQEGKVDSNLGEFLTTVRGLSLPENSYLFSIIMKVKDDEKALDLITKNRANKKLDPDQSEYLKEIMYYPLSPEECFLSVSDNIFNTTIAKAQKNFITSNQITGSCVTLEHDGESVKHTFVNKKPISNFPHTHADDKDAPIQIWEMPVASAPYGLYTAGVDSYRQANSADSASLGAVYIFKRIHSIHDEKYKNMFVAAYVARPEDKNRWNENARNLIKFYNARTLVENDEASFIDYMIGKGDEHYLEPEPQYLKGLVANSRVTGRRYGIHRSAAVIMNQLHTSFKSYMEEVIDTQRDKETGAIIKEVLGVSQILDPMLLEEVIKFNPDLNVDRIVAAELALSLGLYLNRSGIVSSTEDDVRMQSYANRGNRQSMFKQHSSQFTKQKRLFR